MLTARGVKPVCISHQLYQSTWLFGVFSPITGEHLLMEFPTCNSDNFQIFLDGLAAENPKTLIIMGLDNGAFHASTSLSNRKAKKLKIPYNIKLIFIPPYTPELNPAEKIWARIKREFTNKIFHSLEEIGAFLDKAANNLSKSIVISTCAYKYIFFDPFWNEI
jgi:transposase